MTQENEKNSINYAIVLYEPDENYFADTIEIKKDHNSKVFLFLCEALSIHSYKWIDIHFTDKKNVFNDTVIQIEFVFGFDNDEETETVEEIAKYINEKMNS